VTFLSGSGDHARRLVDAMHPEAGVRHGEGVVAGAARDIHIGAGALSVEMVDASARRVTS
jgi:hypothetical protein